MEDRIHNIKATQHGKKKMQRTDVDIQGEGKRMGEIKLVDVSLPKKQRKKGQIKYFLKDGIDLCYA